MNKTCYLTSFNSDLRKAKDEIGKILNYLKKEDTNISESDLFDLRIIYSELIFNAILHGNKQNPLKKVEIFIEITDNNIMSIIKDDGVGFNYAGTVKADADFGTIMNENGKGLKLASSLTDSIQFNEFGNEVMFVKKRPQRKI